MQPFLLVKNQASWTGCKGLLVQTGRPSRRALQDLRQLHTPHFIWVLVGKTVHLIFQPSLIWIFSLRSVECDEGFYGQGCEKKCTCPSGLKCDAVTGACLRQCPAGKKGERCDQGEFRGCAVLFKWFEPFKSYEVQCSVYLTSYFNVILQTVRLGSSGLAALSFVPVQGPHVTKWQASADVLQGWWAAGVKKVSWHWDKSFIRNRFGISCSNVYIGMKYN